MDSGLLLHWSDVAQRRRLSCGNCLRCANEGSRLPKQGVCFASGSDSAVGRPGGAKEHAVAQIGGYLNHSGGSSSSLLSGFGGSSRSSAPATDCNLRRNTAFQGSAATSVVLATKAGFVAIISSKMAC
jgi:hypothetical protein